jgi:histidinol dehydrogenase
MLSRLDLRGANADLSPLTARGDAVEASAVEGVRAIIAEVRGRGDDALRDLTEQFDGCTIDDLRVPGDELLAALEDAPSEFRAALEYARDEVTAYHEAQLGGDVRVERNGVLLRELVVPVDRAGLYVPGGRATYPSTVLMTAIPARVAGVPEIALCVPPDPNGRVPAVTLAAAALAGVDEVYRVGGAQAIAALAYGTETIDAVDVIVGPGNAYVAEAKRQVAADVAIDGYAGPSEVAIIADDTAPPVLVAADLLAQAEHGPGGACAVITWSESLGAEVERALRTRLDDARTATPETESTLRAGGRLVLVDGPEQAIAAANVIAPEHLELMCADAEDLVPLVRNAGAVFVGNDASAVLGDYVAGVNHVLPTGGTARFADALRVDDFRKHMHIVSVAPDALGALVPAVTTLAEAEGLFAHADAMRLRERT